MHNYLLFNDAFFEVSLEQLQNNLYILNDLFINKRDSERFHIHNSLYSYETTIGVFSQLIFSQIPDEQFRRNILPRLLNSLTPISDYPSNEQELDEKFTSSINGFYGLNFSETTINQLRQIYDKASYQILKYNFELITNESFWKNKITFFDNVNFCDSIENCKDYFLSLPNSSAVVERIKTIEFYYIETKDDEFGFDNFLSKTGLNCSPESPSTLNQFHRERTFTLPDGRLVIFSWHIKLGDVRIYFLSEEVETYIPYIGVHLPTKKFKK